MYGLGRTGTTVGLVIIQVLYFTFMTIYLESKYICTVCLVVTDLGFALKYSHLQVLIRTVMPSSWERVQIRITFTIIVFCLPVLF